MTFSDMPQHPAVNWSRTKRIGARGLFVRVTCPHCKKARWDHASLVRYRIVKGTYGGQCYRDRLIKKPRADRLARPKHPAVDWSDIKLVDSGRQRVSRVAVTCPKCQRKRYAQPGSLAARLRAPGKRGFTGECLRCSKNAPKHQWKRLSPGRKLDPQKGYVRINREAVAEDDRWLYDAMRKRVPAVLEHRLVMAKVLGRPLLANELVDHMDGIKTNNDPANLRIYIRGKNQPGETSGYGTYYDEWQRALARIAELEKMLGL